MPPSVLSVNVDHPGHGVRTSEVSRALTLDHSLLPRLLLVDGLVARARAKVEAYAAVR